MDQITQLYQNVNLKATLDENMSYSKILSHDAAMGGRFISHLKEAIELPVKAANNRVIIVADTTASGYQAATYLLLKSQSCGTSYEGCQNDRKDASVIDHTAGKGKLEDEEDDIFDELYDEILDEYGEDEFGEEENDYGKETEKPVSSFHPCLDMLIENAEIFDSRSDDLDMQNLITLQKQMSSGMAIDKVLNLLLYCGRNEQDKEKVMEAITYRLTNYRNIFLLLPSDSVSENFVERLVFEYDFNVIHIKEPSMDQLESIFISLVSTAGYQLKSNTDVRGIINSLKGYRGRLFWEKDMEKLINATAGKLKGRKAGEEDFKLYYYRGKRKTGEMQLNELIGQEEVKEQVKSITALRRFSQMQEAIYGEHIEYHKHMAFEGAPGTGKTQVARIVAEIFREHGLSNGIFVEAGRQDIIAPYLGQTAIKIRNLFRKARGGVLFIDEAGSLIENERDIYVKEALTTLLCFMENNPETTVIFATYNDEMQRLLSSDRGLSSRISKVIEFKSYTLEELWNIFQYMAGKQHLTVDEEAREPFNKYIEACIRNSRQDFGNAREVRKLLQAAKEELAMRFLSDCKQKGCDTIISYDVERAGHKLLRKTAVEKPVMGFALFNKGGGVSYEK